ncbi:hypothetical protein [Sporosarcina sp. Te-1]|uniref:hypothetical protein n=1 Tax=Sporosarcina sp. Te-1 TaxID=2818390 RepID=UPI001A9E9D96|nr:hypothetical protein [Sporosarcina sp. Te-1]QTD40870.1 hypothetical protein J3U78_19340 [Sporosarcina sp. Te-1]
MRCKGIALLFSIVAVACSALIIISAHLLDDWAEAGLDLERKSSAVTPDARVDVGEYLVQWQAEMNYNGFTEEQVEEGKGIVEKHLGEVKLTSLNRD